MVESFLHDLRGQNTKYGTRFSKAKGTKKACAGPGMEVKQQHRLAYSQPLYPLSWWVLKIESAHGIISILRFYSQ